MRNVLICLLKIIILLAIPNCNGSKAGEPGEEVHRFDSPDGNYAIVVRFATKSTNLITPGSSGDRPGFVQLVNRQNEILKQLQVSMVGQIDQVFWREDEVEVKLVVTWKLGED